MRRPNGLFGIAALLLQGAALPLQVYLSAHFGTTCHGEHVPIPAPRWLDGMAEYFLLLSLPVFIVGFFADREKAWAKVAVVCFFPAAMLVGFLAGCS